MLNKSMYQLYSVSFCWEDEHFISVSAHINLNKCEHNNKESHPKIHESHNSMIKFMEISSKESVVNVKSKFYSFSITNY